jgi:hypothetical protein
MKSIITETRHEITGADILHYDQCVGMYDLMSKKPNCTNCDSMRKTSCIRIRAWRKNHNPEPVTA